MTDSGAETMTTTMIWFISILITFAFGVCVNLALLIILVRFRKVTDALITSGIIQTVIDLLICLVYVIHMCSLHVDVHFHVVSFILCHLILSDALLWGLIAVRLNMSMLTAFFYFIQFIFPFMRIEQRRRATNLAMGLLLSLCGLLGAAPHLFTIHYNDVENKCTGDVGEDFLMPSRVVITLRLVILIGLVYNFLVPIGTGAYLYHHVLHVLRIRDKSRHAAAYKEMRLNAIQDLWLQAGSSVLAVCIMFAQKYPNADSLKININVQYIGYFFLGVYSVVYPCVSVAFRRKYRKPVLECLIQMGMHPTDSWLAQRWSVGITEKPKTSMNVSSFRRRTTKI
ncbi:unnamed protein product [Echinostoma caproni]|uniref:G_PROTEIN_RECEP_F1_2 domain-containing protein n=1 Tax=Echinostoma caproni TaxID=27848 RepID=A0A183B4Y6_9TREM|nr:unnamed protein product [Echinostoma caproni]